MISVEAWTVKYETELVGKNLIEWVMCLDEEELRETSQAVEGETKPAERDAQIAWKKNWMIVKNCLEGSLGEDCQAVYEHEEYERIRSDPGCRAIKRIIVIGRILRDLATGPSSSLAPLSSPSKRPLPPSFEPPPPSRRSTFFTSSPSPVSGATRGFIPIAPRPASTTPRPELSAPTSSSSSKREIQRASVREAMRDTDSWGDRCCRCGHIGLDKPAGHRTFACNTATHLDIEGPSIPILTTYVDQPQKHLLLSKAVDGLKKGAMLCAVFNWSRPRAGGCAIPDCPLVHACSLCFDQSHRAIDCPAHIYRPMLEPRPLSLPPVGIPVAGSSSLAPSRQLRPRPSQLAMPPPSSDFPSSITRASGSSQPRSLPISSTRPPGPSSQSSSSPMHGSNASTQPIKYLFKDSFFDAIGTAVTTPRFSLPKKTLPPGTGARRMNPKPRRIERYTNILRPQARQYPRSVPSVIQERPGYRNRWTPNEIVQDLSPRWKARVLGILEHATSLKSLSDVDLQSQRAREQSFFDKIRQKEVEKGLNVKAWETPRMGLVESKRFQRADGDTWKSGIALMGHYPPSHSSPHAFTPTRDGGALLQQGGLASPTLTRNYQLSFANLVPVFFDLENGTEGMSIPKTGGGTVSYPPSIIKLCQDHYSKDIMARCAAGSKQLLVSLGANARDACKMAARQASNHPEYEVETFSIQSRKIRAWEVGGLCMESLLLRQRHLGQSRSVSDNGTLFGHTNYDDRERTAVTMDRKGEMGDRPLTLDFIVIVHKGHPHAGIVIHTAEHMSFASHTTGNSSLDIGTKLDLGITLVEDLFFDRFRAGRFPAPEWRFANRKIMSLLVSKEEKAAGVSSFCLTRGEDDLLRKLPTLVPFQRVRPECLPDRFQMIYKSIDLLADPNGIEVDPNDPIDIIRKGSNARLIRHKAISASRPPSQASVTSRPATRPCTPAISPSSVASTLVVSRSAQPSSSSLSATQTAKTASQPTDVQEYESVCECGVVSKAPFITGEKIVMREYTISATGRHKVLVKEREAGKCLTGIPIFSELVRNDTMVVYAGKHKEYYLNSEIQERMTSARARAKL